MKSGIAILLIFLLASCSSFDENCLPYHLYTVNQKADLNYAMIDRINTLPAGKVKLRNEFRPIKGNYTVARFISFGYDVVSSDYYSETNNIIILKIDSTNTIVDGYQYYLQRDELPLKISLYRISAKGVKAERNLNIKKLKFKSCMKKVELGWDDVPDFKGKGVLIISKNYNKNIFNSNISDDLKEPENYIYPADSEKNEFIIKTGY